MGKRSIPVGIVALAVIFAVKSGGTPAGPADAGWPGARSRVSVFGTIHPAMLDLRPPVGMQIAAYPGMPVASLPARVDAAAGEEQAQTQTTGSTSHRDSFDERFASSFGERRAAEVRSVVFAAPSASAAPLSLPPLEPAAPKIAPPAVGRSPSEPAAAARAPLPAASAKSVRIAEPRADRLPLPDPDNRTAIYDIAAHVVYLPNGQKLEAHSGLGRQLDDPRYVSVRNRGPTPPNVYDLVLRGQRFHGVRALRLIPADEGKMFGRDGILAHSYMLGPNGQSNGCVSFSNYQAFLNAFLKGEVDRLVVVERLATAPGQATSPGWLSESLRRLFSSS